MDASRTSRTLHQVGLSDRPMDSAREACSGNPSHPRHTASLGAADSDTQPGRCRAAKARRGGGGLLVVTSKFPRFALSAEIQTPSGPPSIDSLIAHDQTNPGARDLRIGQIDIFPNQHRCALALCVNEPSARSTVPVEKEIDAVICRSCFGLTLFPFVRSISPDRGVHPAVPPTGPISFDSAVLIVVLWGRPGF